LRNLRWMETTLYADTQVQVLWSSYRFYATSAFSCGP